MFSIRWRPAPRGCPVFLAAFKPHVHYRYEVSQASAAPLCRREGREASAEETIRLAPLKKDLFTVNGGMLHSGRIHFPAMP